ncbi:Bifunctional DNA-directed RNA polymerase subunit beta-beta' [compost metagenome]|jgi:hypothetical protein
MGVEAEIVSHDELFHSLTSTPVIINDFDVTTEADRERLNQMIMTRYEGDTLDVVPSCECKKVKFEHNVGVVCDNCGFTCMSVTERPLESLLWITTPKGVDTLINPWAFHVLKPVFVYKGTNLLDWITNPSYIPPNNDSANIIQYLKGLGIGRGINAFYRNFDSLMNLFLREVLPNNKNQQQMDDTLLFIQMYRKQIFSKYLPCPSRVTFITENTATGTYADTGMTPAVSAMRTFSAIENSPTPLRQREVELRTIKALNMLVAYYAPFITTQLGGKPGWYRKHIFGSRVNFSFRGVISSLSDPHHYEDLEAPWSLSVMTFKVHLTAKLLKRGFTPNEANKFLYENTLRYHPLLDELFQELINESPRKGIPVIFQRNPTLTRLSAQRLYIRRIKKDPRINTISPSVNILSGMNADFDGDALNGIVILDQKTLEKLDPLAPRNGVLDLRAPRAISGHVSLSSTIIATIANFIHHGR